MQSRLRILGHPVHPMLVTLPVALFVVLLFLDALHWVTGEAGFWTVGFWIAAAGVLLTALAAAAGVPDLAAIPDGTHAHRTGAWHAAVGTTILVLYGVSAWLRWPVGAVDSTLAVTAVDALGTGLVVAQGWLGGALVYKHHVGVQAPAEGGDPVALGEEPKAARGPSARARRGELR